MRFFTVILMLGIILVGQALAGVIHESKSTVKFKGLGQYTTHDLIYVQGLKQYKESKGDFAGLGMMGQMMSGMMFGPKSDATITDLKAMKIYELFRGKKQYRVIPIERLNLDNMSAGSEESNGPQAETGESTVKIIRQELRVVPTHKTKTIHGFPCEEYHVFWITEWQDTETGRKGKDSLFTDVWSTKKTGVIEKGLQEEMRFQQAYLQKAGVNPDFNAQSILGLNWIKMFQGMKQRQYTGTDFNTARWAKEMQKIKGYPVKIDGEFYAYSSGGKGYQEGQGSEGFDFNNPGGMFGNMFKKKTRNAAKSAMKKRGNMKEPVFAFHTELIKIEVKSLNADRFAVPPDYQKID